MNSSPDGTHAPQEPHGTYLARALQQQTISIRGNSFACTFSGGVCEWPAGLGAETLIKHADEVLYQSKNAGRNKVGVLTPG